MAKAQSRFGGTKPSDKATKVRQAGYDIGKKGSPTISSGGGTNTGQASKNRTAPRRGMGVPNGPLRDETHVRQVGTNSAGSTNHQMVRDPNFRTKAIKGRPSVRGKEDNRTSWR